MSVQAAFLFVAPNVEKQKHHALIEMEGMTLKIAGAKTYKEAVDVAKQLVAEGVTCLELCAGFGNEGVAEVAKAVGPKIAVGVVRFDFHPGFGFKSGDRMF